MMQCGKEFIRLDGDDRTGAKRFSVGRAPLFPEAREGEETAIAPALLHDCRDSL